MSKNESEKSWSQEEMIGAIKRCAAQLGRAPSADELRRATGLNKYQIRRRFGTYIRFLQEASLFDTGFGRLAEMDALFLDWARIVRSFKKIPTIAEYDLHSKYSVRPLTRRFSGWRKVPDGMRQHAMEKGLIGEWEDVMKIIAEHLEPRAGGAQTFRKTTGSILRRKVRPDQIVYGQPISNGVLTYAPTNENGVLVAFGSVAKDLGFSVLHIQAKFPDGEAMREIEPGQWQRVRIEFEFESKNFLAHMHPIAGCDLIVCWEHNWLECPLEVVELKNVILPGK